jgi:uncharacterized protein YcnI
MTGSEVTVAGAFGRRNRWSRVLVVLVVSTVAGVLSTSPAWGHVTVHPSSLPAGSSDIELTFRIPNERDNANTVMLQVLFPNNLPLLTVDVLPVPGWTATVHTQNLATPVQTDDGTVSQVVSDVTWRATSGGIAPGQYEDFDVAAGSVPDKPAQLVFKALQTYSSGEIVRWIEIPVAGQPEPDFPAPVLTLTPSSTSAVSAASHSAGTVQRSSGTSSTAEILAIIALAVSVLSFVGLLTLVSMYRKRTTSPLSGRTAMPPTSTP